MTDRDRLAAALTDNVIVRAVAFGEPEYCGAGKWLMTKANCAAMRDVLLDALTAEPAALDERDDAAADKFIDPYKKPCHECGAEYDEAHSWDCSYAGDEVQFGPCRHRRTDR